MDIKFHHILFFLPVFISCQSLTKTNPEGKFNGPTTAIEQIPKVVPNEFELADSLQLSHIKNQFYKGTTGHLYERTFRQHETTPDDTTMFAEYFNGIVDQDIDPITFEELNGWFAKDTNYVYYYRPMSGGMMSVKISEAIPKTFKIIKGEYEFAVDKYHVYFKSDCLKGLNPHYLKIVKGNEGRILKLMSGKAIYPID